MLKQKAADLSIGTEIAIKETNTFFEYLKNGIKEVEKILPPDTVKFFATELLAGGYNLQVHGHTLVSQHYIKGIDTVTGSFLSLAIYDRVFNKQGLAIDKYGVPELFPIDKHLLAHTRYELYLNEHIQPVWSEMEPKHVASEWKTEELVGLWISDFIKRVSAIMQPSFN